MMELFSEIYNCYYQVVDRILKKGSVEPVGVKEMNRLADTYGYGESAVSIVPHLTGGDWDLLVKTEDGYLSKIDNLRVLPLTRLQKSWLKALISDPRITLFLSDGQLRILEEYLKDVKPLFRNEDFLYFDRYADGDLTGADSYRRHFQMILKGIKERQTLQISYYSGKGKLSERTYLPCRMEYSSKDDKFRCFALFKRAGRDWRLETLNIGRIFSVRETGFFVDEEIDIDRYIEKSYCDDPVVLEISEERNGLERAMLHFACYEKRIEKTDTAGKYLCYIYYNQSVETELLIQILSFGPVIRVVGPESFLEQVKMRVRKQARLM
ncbi:WYL domain-containing protein [Clostridium sp. MCC353]|uniref:WYL domain-containing protein n=1 Tax=Clostridium sp. MCC353 TaxID=2592646 RepID=UPI001C0354EC|nr:WYL domain-containing protein [Clostridium sp. MCC353]MBT9778272.1 WYL domain-containing protein [Clostridium sp. MCC353]